MATSILPLRKIQFGEETSGKGTLVAATNQLVGEGRLAEEQDFYRSEYPRGVRATVGGAGTIVRKGAMLSWQTELNAEDILVPLHTGVLGNVSPTNTNSEYSWAFVPVLTSGIPVVDSVTVEYVESDGSTNHIASEAGYGMTSRLKISWAPNEIAKLEWDMFLRSRQTSTPTGSLTPYTGREPLKGSLVKTYLDTAWGSLGNTQLAGLVRSGDFELNTGLAPDYTADGRSDLDFVKHMVGKMSGSLSLVLELDATGAARYQDFRDNDIVYIRFIAEGSTVVANPRSVQVDGAYRFVGEPGITYDNEQALVTLPLELVYDETGTAMVEITVVNGLDSL